MNFFIENPGSEWKSILLTDKALVLSTKEYSSEEEMSNNLKQINKMEQRKKFGTREWKKIDFLSDSSSLTIKETDFRNKVHNNLIGFGSNKIMNEVISGIEKRYEFNRIEEKGKFSSIVILPMIKMLIAGAITGLAYLAAIDISNGSTTVSGKRTFLKQILSSIIEEIGPTGVLIIGGVITLFLLFQLVTRLIDPPSRIILTNKK